MTIVEVAKVISGGVGDRIAGRGDGQTTGVATVRGMYPLLQDAIIRISRIARVILVNFRSIPSLVSCAPGEARTRNHWIRSPLLYPLSYGGRKEIITEFVDLLHYGTHDIISPRAGRRSFFVR
jgi:hypothetical protein